MPRTSRTLALPLALVSVSGALLAGCGGSAPSTSRWAAQVSTECKALAQQRQAAAKALPADRAPTVDELMSFSAGFAPTFTQFSSKVRTFKRPSGNTAAIEELLGATDAYASHLSKLATDADAAAAEIAADGQTPESTRLEDASKALGLDACNG